MRLLLLELEKHFRPITKLKKPLADQFQFEVDVAPQLYSVDYAAFNTDRGQWNAEHVLAQMRSGFAEAPYSVVLAYFPYDAYAHNYKRVFGIADNNGKVALVAYHYLDPAFHGEANDELFLDRLLKKSTHHVGHALGLSHCSRRSCVMNFSRNLLFLDRKTPNFCNKCRFLL
ncbi:archaemetzincin [Candidatus Micrarchaeota archaeon]|nr:archaemetzincin [Candidatus Micrarchaeota archaeon]